MKKNHSLFSLAALIGMMLCLFSANVSAAPIDVEQARQVVENFRKKAARGGMRRAPMAKGRLNHCYTKRTQAGTPAVYAFTNEGGGFALVAADDAVASVLGYSDTGTFDPDNIPDGLQYLLDEYAKGIAAAGPRKANEQLPEPPYEVEETEQLGPLLETKWGQMRPYNLQSPLSIVGNAATGCMTTAIAQIMRYHKWPEQGYGSCEFDVNEGYNTIFTVRDYYTRHYNWDVMYPHTSQYTMRDEKNYDTNAVDVASVSQLMFDIGVGLSTDYTISGVSSAVEVRIIPMLTSYFNYDPGLEFVTLSKTTPEAFNHMLIEELQASRPVYLQGGPLGYGHAFVCDGYNGQGHFHINWGWEGKSDGYYLITGLTPAQQGTGGGSSSGYSENLKMLRHIMPYDGVAPRPQFKINRYSVEADANGNYLAAQFGVTKDRNIRGQLGVLVIDTEGNGKLFWDKDGGYTQINTAGTEGAYYDFHVNVDPSWTAPGTRVYYIYKECGDPQWRYVKDGGNNYCCIKFGLSGGNIVAEHNTSEPNYTGTPGNYYLNDDYEYALGNKITSLSQIQSGHVYAIARHNGPGFASINPSGGVLQGRTTFDTQGTTAFVFTGNTTAGYTIKSAVANAYLPVLTTTDSNGNVVSLGWGQEKFAIEDFNGDITDGLQIKSLGSSYASGKVYLHCTGTTNNFLGWHGYSGGDSQMDIYEVTVNGQHTMPGTSEKLVVRYNIFLGNKKIGTQVYEETVGQAPTKDFVPYFVTAEDFPQTITGDVTAYDIHTSYNDKLPVDPSQYFNIGFTQGTTTYWWYNTGDGNGYCKESTTTPSATDKTAQWTFVGDWLNGFVVKNANQGKIVWARDVVNNSPIFLAVDQALDDKTFLLEHRDAGFYLHLKGRTMYLTHQSSNNVSINNTLNNAANLLTFAVPGEDPTIPDTPVDPVDPDTPDEPTGPYSLGDRVANIADIVSGELYAIVRHAGAGYATFDASTGKVSGKETYPTDGTAAFVFTGDNTNGYTIKSALTDAYFPVLTTTDGNGTPVVLGSNPEKYIIKDYDSNIGTGVQIASKSSSYTGTDAFDGGSSNVYLNSGDTTRDFVGYWKKNGGNTQMDIYKVNYNGGETPVDPTPELNTYTVNVVGAPTGQTVTVTVKGQTVTGTSVTLDSSVSVTDVSATDISGYTYSVEVNGTTITVTYELDDTPVGVTYTVNVVGAPTGQTITVTVKGQTVTGTSVTLDSTVSVTDVSATAISGYTYSVEVNGTTITVTYELDNTPVPVTYTFTVDGETIGTKVINETAGAAPTVASIIPSYVHASGIPATVEQNAYTIATTYTDLPFEVGKKYYINISNRVYWLYANSSYSCVKEATSKGTSSEYVWTTGGDWLNGFSFVNGLGYYIGAPSATPANSATTTVPTADGTLTRFDLVRNSDLGYRFKPHGGSNYLGHTSYTALNLSFFDYYARDLAYNYSNTLMFEEAVDEAGELQEKINTLLGMDSKIGTVGYPAWDHTAVTTLIENYMDDGVTDANYSAALMAYQTAIGTSDVVLPKPGHAYKLSLRSLDGTKHWYLTNNGVSTNEADAAIFVMGSSGRTDDYKAIFVTNDNTASYLLQYKGATGASYASGTCDFKIEPMVTKTGTTVTASVLQRFGTFALTSETRPDGYTGTPGTLIFKETENKWDAANGAFMNGTYTTAIEMTEVPYPYTKPKLVAGDNGSFASIWLPFPMTFPEGVEVYKGTQERDANGNTFLGLERVDTNRAVAAGGYILYSETLTGEIDVQPVAGTPADKHNTTDAAFYGCTEIYGTETGEMGAWYDFKTAHSDATPYVLANKSKGIGFYRYTGTVFPKGKAIWMSPNGSAETVKFNFDDVITALDALHGHQSIEGLYDLQGHRLDKVQKGQVNVINGKKILIK